MTINYFFLITLVFFNFFLVYFFDSYSQFFKINDYPDGKRKIHKKAIKVFGGTIMLLNLALFVFYSYFFDLNNLTKIFSSEKELIIFFFTSILIYIVGLIDDKVNIPALNKLLLISCIISIHLFLNQNLISEIKLSFFGSIHLYKLSFIFTLFSYIIFMNAFNMLDGINLQVGIYSCFITLFLILNGLNLAIGLSIIIALLSYLKLNYDNKIFFGDNGTLFLSYVFSYFFIKLYNIGDIKFSDEILLILLLPGLEITRLIFTRLVSNKNILRADSNHIHHLVKFNENNIFSFFFIQFLFAAPYLLSILYKNNLIIIIFYSAFYFLTIQFFKKK